MFQLPSLASFWPEPPRGSAAADVPRALLLNGLHVSWRLRRSQRRSIGLRIDEQGLAVTAPRWTPLAEIEAALQSKANWITRQLALAQERRQRQQSRSPPQTAAIGAAGLCVAAGFVAGLVPGFSAHFAPAGRPCGCA